MKHTTCSGRLSLRMDQEKHKKLGVVADSFGMAINSLINMIIAEALPQLLEKTGKVNQIRKDSF